jgi:putative ABC transport system permease protein
MPALLPYYLASAFAQMRRYRLQSALIVLGVGIGIANIIVLIGMTDLGRRQTMGLIEEFGANLLIITPFVDFGSGPAAVFSNANSGGYLPEELRLALADCPALAEPRLADTGEKRLLAGLLQISANVEAGGEWTSHVVAGATVQVPEFSKFVPAKGRWLNAEDMRQFSAVACLGRDAAREIFGAADPLGQSLRIKGREFNVVGVLRPAPSVGLEENDRRIFIPLSTAQQIFEFPGMHGMLARYRSGLSEEQALAGVKDCLARGLKAGERLDDVVSVFTVKEARKLMDRTLGVFRKVLFGISSIALIVAGIGIMNVMLLRVMRRRTEIGIRRAAGATAGSIAAQFLTECLVQALMGSLLGIAMGLGALALFCRYAEWQFGVSLPTVALAVGYGALVGIAFGVYPAWRAGRVDPIASLRSEF